MKERWYTFLIFFVEKGKTSGMAFSIVSKDRPPKKALLHHFRISPWTLLSNNTNGLKSFYSEQSGWFTGLWLSADVDLSEKQKNQSLD